MAHSNLKLADQDGVLWITLNRPDKLNALNVETVLELDRVFTEEAASPEVLAVVVTGAGDKAFAAGADIAELAELDPAAAREFALRGQAVLDRIEGMPKPVIAAVNGYALGGGCELAMACHLRVAATNAVFGQPEVKLGLIPGYAGTQRLSRLVGTGRAMELIVSGRTVPAEEAERIGLVNRVVEPLALAQEVAAFLKPILGNGPAAVARSIEAINHGSDMAFEDGCLLEATLFALCAGTEEMREGTAAFLEKRKPRFRGGE